MPQTPRPDKRIFSLNGRNEVTEWIEQKEAEPEADTLKD